MIHVSKAISDMRIFTSTRKIDFSPLTVNGNALNSYTLVLYTEEMPSRIKWYCKTTRKNQHSLLNHSQ